MRKTGKTETQKYFIVVLCMAMTFAVMLTGCGKGELDESEAEGVCTIEVECSTILDNLDDLEDGLLEYLPEDGVILKETEVEIYGGETVYDILKDTLKDEGILMEASFTAGTAYIEGIDNFYEFSCGKYSGWMYCVNGVYPNVGCSEYQVEDGDEIEWRYTCDLGEDLQ